MNDKQKNQEQIKINKKLIVQAEKEVEKRTMKYELQKSMLKFQREHCKIIDGKPEWLQCPEYMKMSLDLNELDFEMGSVNTLDEIERAKSFIVNMGKENQKLLRGHKLEEKKVEEVKNE